MQRESQKLSDSFLTLAYNSLHDQSLLLNLSSKNTSAARSMSLGSSTSLYSLRPYKLPCSFQQKVVISFELVRFP